LPRIYDNFVAQVSGIGEHKAGSMADIVALKKQIATAEAELQSLERKMRKEPQLDKQLQMNKQVKAKRQNVSELRKRLEELGI
jgi:predicted RNase H-like nuclease (RuvC/YqgF family)